MTDRLLEDGTPRRLEDMTVRLLEEPVVVDPPPDYEPPLGLVARLTEDGQPRLLEDGTVRYLEQLAPVAPPPGGGAPVIVRPFRFALGPRTAGAGTVELADNVGVALKASRADGWSADFALSATDLAANTLDELASDLFVARFSQPWRRLRVMSIDQEWDESGGIGASCVAGEPRAVLNRRFLWADLTFTAEDQGAIAWALIEHSQTRDGGDLGLTAGVLDDTIQRERTYLTGDNIGQRLRELSEVIDGPWYEIDASLAFHARARGTERRYSIPLQLGVTARRLRRASGAAQFANAVQGTGDNEQTTRVLAESVDIATDPRGRWEAVAAWSSVVVQDTLDEHTAGELSDRVRPLTQWVATIDAARWLSDFPVEPFDIVEVVVPRSTIAPAGTPATRVLAQVDTLSFSVLPSGEVTNPEVTLVEVEA